MMLKGHCYRHSAVLVEAVKGFEKVHVPTMYNCSNWKTIFSLCSKKQISSDQPLREEQALISFSFVSQ